MGEKVAGVTSEANPDTSDGIIAWFILGGISLIGLAGTMIYRKKFSV